ncbi:hypothetical protein S7711_10577 [Stachybotrys chartarum IBT 7711]|uniref:Uncharacterized protein n=1 Tax=Stachybotrys chartarum (strain CBS 109288 / IBT 7711) TaxID=1280523 RepID=A0A084B551_STACB|nr:hypothetical protein S7711_10577 [Stachybotrys chartarum IBT 7711]KFA79832.1 hypothetical protein S40288_10502 [Stachybotrys chartarum IBT 40288]
MPRVVPAPELCYAALCYAELHCAVRARRVPSVTLHLRGLHTLHNSTRISSPNSPSREALYPYVKASPVMHRFSFPRPPPEDPSLPRRRKIPRFWFPREQTLSERKLPTRGASTPSLAQDMGRRSIVDCGIKPPSSTGNPVTRGVCGQPLVLGPLLWQNSRTSSVLKPMLINHGSGGKYTSVLLLGFSTELAVRQTLKVAKQNHDGGDDASPGRSSLVRRSR